MAEGASCCPICRRDGARELGAKNSYRLFRCSACGHLFVFPIAGAENQSEDYSVYEYDRRDLQHVPPGVFARLTEVVTSFRSHRKTGRLLEVGFGAGAMLRAARDNDWDVHGIEISSLAVKQARQNGFLKVAEGDFLRAPYEPGFFDVIVAIEVLEHLPDSLAFVRQASRLLAPGGLFYATTPNYAGLSGRILGLDWSAVAPPEHLQLFSVCSIRAALSANGFGSVTLACEGINPFEILHHFRKKIRAPARAGESSRFDPTASSSALNEKLTGSPTGFALKSAANWALRQAAWGDTIKARAVR